MADINIGAFKMQIGVISCSGEEMLGGTLTRMATRKVMEELRPGQAISLCLPLFLAGGEEERNFAKNFPVISVDACEKHCARKSTEKYSGRVRDCVVLTDFLDPEVIFSKTVSMKDLTEEHYHMVDKIAEEICKKIDAASAGS